jgi:hypothetical protein
VERWYALIRSIVVGPVVIALPAHCNGWSVILTPGKLTR